MATQHCTGKNLNYVGDLPSLATVLDAVVLRRSVTAVQWVLVATAAYAGALAVNAVLAFWLDTGDGEDATGIDLTPPEATAVGPAQASDYSAIFRRNLFGSEPIAMSETTLAASGVDVASLDLHLRGTAEVDGTGYAVIEDRPSHRQDVFAVGEQVFDGPELVEVTPGRAVVSMAGRRETLEISAVSAGTQNAAAEGAGGGIRKTGANTYLVDRREVEHSIENLSAVATQMRAVPYLKDGSAIGFRVFNIRPGSLFERMGLENGDVIQKVNGAELDTPSKGLALLEDVQTTSEIRIDLLRNNRPTTLNYTVR